MGPKGQQGNDSREGGREPGRGEKYSIRGRMKGRKEVGVNVIKGNSITGMITGSKDEERK